MNRPFNDKILSFIFKLLLLCVIAKTIALAAFIALPKDGFESQNVSAAANFGGYGFSGAFNSASSSSGVSSAQLSSLKLLAVYKEAKDDGGYAIISDGVEADVVKNGGEYKQYTLDEIKNDGIYLASQTGRFWLGFVESTLDTAAVSSPSVIAAGKRPILAQLNAANEPYTNVIQRSEIQEMLANPDAVFKNIGFREVMRNGKIDGFRVLSINRNSPLAKLGLRAGDIVKSFNGVLLDNYSSVLEIYNNVNSLSRVKIEVMRNNEMKEFEYAIY